MPLRTSEIFCLGVGAVAGAALVVGMPYIRKNVLPKLVAADGTLGKLYATVAEKVAMEIEKLQDEAATTAAESPAAEPVPPVGPMEQVA